MACVESRGHVITVCLIVGPAFVWALSRAAVPPSIWAGGCVRPVLGGVVMLVVGHFVVREVESDFWTLVIGTILSVAAYAAIVLPGEHGFIRQRQR